MNRSKAHSPVFFLVIVIVVCGAGWFAFSFHRPGGWAAEAGVETSPTTQELPANRDESPALQLRREAGQPGSAKTFAELHPTLEAFAKSGASNSERMEILKFLIATLEDPHEAELAVEAMCRMTDDLSFRLEAFGLLGTGDVKTGVRRFIFSSAKIEELGKLSGIYQKITNDGERQNLIYPLVEKLSDKSSFDALNDWIGSNVDAAQQVTAKGALVNKLVERIAGDPGMMGVFPFSELRKKVPLGALENIVPIYARSYLNGGDLDRFRETVGIYPLAQRVAFIRALPEGGTLSEEAAAALKEYAGQLELQREDSYSGDREIK